jgi:hypothetical protein
MDRVLCLSKIGKKKFFERQARSSLPHLAKSAANAGFAHGPKEVGWATDRWRCFARSALCLFASCL